MLWSWRHAHNLGNLSLSPLHIPVNPGVSYIHEEIWTNGRTDCVLSFWRPSNPRRTNLGGQQQEEVLVENSSADHRYHGSVAESNVVASSTSNWHAFCAGKSVHLMHAARRYLSTISWNDDHYSHCLNRAPPCNEGIVRRWTYQHWKFWFNEVCLQPMPQFCRWRHDWRLAWSLICRWFFAWCSRESTPQKSLKNSWLTLGGCLGYPCCYKRC